MLEKFLSGSQLKKELIKGSSVIYVSNFTSVFFRFLLTIFLASGLGATKYGLIQLAISAASLIAVLIDIRIGEAVTKFVAEYESLNEKNRSLTVIFIGYFLEFALGLISFLLIYASASLVAVYILKQPIETTLIRIYAFAILFGISNGTSNSFLQALKEFKKLGAIQIISSFFNLILPVALLRYGIKAVLWGYVFAHLITTACVLVIILPVLYKNFKGVGLANFKSELKRIIPFCIQTFLSVSFKSINRYIDLLILGFFRKPAEVGIYKIALSFCSVIGNLATPANVVLYPNLSDLWARGEVNIFKRLLKKVSKIMAYLTIPIAGLLILFSELILKLTVGSEFIKAESAIYIIIWAIIASNILVWLRPVVLSIGRPDISTKANAAMSLFIVILSLILVPFFGFIGSAVSYLVTYMVGSTIMLFMIRKAIRDSSTLNGAVIK